MANLNLSDMFARRVFQTAFRSQAPVASNNVSSALLAHLAHMSTSDRPAAPSLEENAYYDKYREKLEKIKRSKPHEFEAAVNSVYGDKPASKSEDGNFTDSASVMTSMRKTSKSPVQGKPSASAESDQKRDLNSIVKLDLLHDKSASDISQIWTKYFSTKEGVIFASIQAEQYHRLKTKGRECPLFIYAIPRDSGYEFMLGQCSGDDWYYTPLIAYQTHGEFAPYSLAVQYYTELADPKGIVLMKGEIAAQDLKPELATLLVHQTQLMYGSDINFETVKQMHVKPDEFKHMDIVSICKKAGLF